MKYQDNCINHERIVCIFDIDKLIKISIISKRCSLIGCSYSTFKKYRQNKIGLFLRPEINLTFQIMVFSYEFQIRRATFELLKMLR